MMKIQYCAPEIKLTVKYGGGSVILIACMAAAGVGKLFVIVMFVFIHFLSE